MSAEAVGIKSLQNEKLIEVALIGRDLSTNIVTMVTLGGRVGDERAAVGLPGYRLPVEAFMLVWSLSVFRANCLVS